MADAARTLMRMSEAVEMMRFPRDEDETDDYSDEEVNNESEEDDVVMNVEGEEEVFTSL